MYHHSSCKNLLYLVIDCFANRHHIYYHLRNNQLSVDEYSESKSLPCGKIVCTTCQFKNEIEAIDKRFEANVRFDQHELNKEAFINSKPMEIVLRPQEYFKLGMNLNSIKKVK